MSDMNEARDFIYVDAAFDRIQQFPFADGHVAIFSRRSPAKETANEDAAAVLRITEGTGVLAVADGCGGMAGGDIASRKAVKALQASIARIHTEEISLRAAILDGIERANLAVREMGTGAATTLAVVEIVDSTVRSYHVGDSTVLLVGNRGKVKLHTRSHSPVGYAVQAGVISEDEAIHHEDRHLVSNVVGTHDAHIELGLPRRMSPRDTLLIASDGVFDNLRLDEIVQLIRKGPLQRAANDLADQATQRMESPETTAPSKPDDLTFILFRRKS